MLSSRPLRHRSPLIAAILLLVAAGAAATDAPWPRFRGPLSTGGAVEGLPEGEGPLDFELRWKRGLGSGYSGISIAGGSLVTSFTEGDGVTPNDVAPPPDGDVGANDLQNYPVLEAALTGSLTVRGGLDSTPDTTFRVEFFANTAADPSGHGEGERAAGLLPGGP